MKSCFGANGNLYLISNISFRFQIGRFRLDKIYYGGTILKAMALSAR